MLNKCSKLWIIIFFKRVSNIIIIAKNVSDLLFFPTKNKKVCSYNILPLNPRCILYTVIKRRRIYEIKNCVYLFFKATSKWAM